MSHFKRHLVRLAAVAAVLLPVALVAWAEARTSLIQSLVFTRMAAQMRAPVRPEAARHARFPTHGPYDERLGYARLPEFVKALQARHFTVQSQAEPSPEMRRFIERGGSAIYHEKSRAGLSLFDRSGVPLYAAHYPEQAYADFDDVPPLLVKSLLFIEDHELLDPRFPRRNPAVDWSRLPLAIAGQLLGLFNPRLKRGGASTLATQIEKFRHSPGGRTSDAAEKWRQMLAASLRAYLDGPDTMGARRRIVTTYLNSTPLSSQAGYGEVIGIGNGLWAWYGTDFGQATRILRAPATDPAGVAVKARVYREALSLMLAEQRPSGFLVEHPQLLRDRTTRYLTLMTRSGALDPALARAALAGSPALLPRAPPEPEHSFVSRKAVDALRVELLEALHLPGLNALDRLDLAADTSLDRTAQDGVTGVLRQLANPAFDQAEHLVGHHLLGPGPAKSVVYSVVLYERMADRNVLRLRADSSDEPFDINSGAKLILGSTAKLRTAVTYLDVITSLHERMAALPAAQLRRLAGSAADPLSRWAAGYLAQAPDRGLKAMLAAAMQRHYSASPGEVFFTGGGEHVFHNFEKSEDYESPTVEEALARSINLAFIRVLHDVVRYYIADNRNDVPQLLAGQDPTVREAYLQRFADQEGRSYLHRFYDDYRGHSPDQALALLASHTAASARHLTVVFRSVRPQASPQQLAAFLAGHLPGEAPDADDLAALYDKYGADRYSLDDRAFLADVHPLELWLVAYLQKHAGASRSQVLQDSAAVRQEAYQWLFKTHNQHAQNARIRILLEQDAFDRIWEDWRRQGYPFSRLVPSLATALGSSGDRPDALAELMGIILDGGLRQPTTDLRRLRFAEGTPYETTLVLRPPPPERVIDPLVADTVRRALALTVELGTAQRLRGVYRDPAGTPIAVGGKTGTGDNRFDVFAPGHRLIESKAVDRTATFVFYLGDRYFGTVTAYVPGPAAAGFEFTSALAVELLAQLEPQLRRMLFPGPGPSCPQCYRASAAAQSCAATRPVLSVPRSPGGAGAAAPAPCGSPGRKPAAG